MYSISIMDRNYFSKSNLSFPYPTSPAGVCRYLLETQEHLLLEDLEHFNF